MPHADVTDTITLTTRDAVEPTCTRYTFDGRALEQTAAGWRVDRMIEECKLGIEVANRLARAEAIERAADGLLDYFAGLPLQSNHLLNLLDSLKAAKAGTASAPVASSSDPCPDEDARQTAVDVQGQHERIKRLWSAAKDVEWWLRLGGLPSDGKLERRLKDALDESKPFATGPTPSQTDAERENERLRGEVARANDNLGELRKRLGEQAATISGLRQQLAGEIATNETLREDLDKQAPREAETAKRCEAVVAACDELSHNCDVIKESETWWTGVKIVRLSNLRTAVDAIRPASTEVRS